MRHELNARGQAQTGHIASLILGKSIPGFAKIGWTVVHSYKLFLFFGKAATRFLRLKT